MSSFIYGLGSALLTAPAMAMELPPLDPTQNPPQTLPAPEIDPTNAVAAIALLVCAVLIIREAMRRRNPEGA
jgi:hypothetical protein